METFGWAIKQLHNGKRVARTGWNGKGMFLILVPGTPNAQLREGSPYHTALDGIQEPGNDGAQSCEILPHIDMWTTNSEGRRAFLPGWLASQTDMLATDWQEV